MSSQRFGNENLTSKLLLNIIKEFRGFLTNIDNSVVSSDKFQNINLGNTQAGGFGLDIIDNFNERIKSNVPIGDGNSIRNKQLIKVKDNYIFDLLDNTMGAFLLTDILSNNTPINFLDSSIKLSDYFLIEYEGNEILGEVKKEDFQQNSVITSGKISCRSLVEPYKATYQKNPPDPGLDPSFTYEDTDGNTKTKEGNFATTNYEPDRVEINKGHPKSANLENPGLGAIIVKNRGIGLPSKNADHLNIFFNAIPPIELARCTPYINVAIVSRSESPNTKNINNVTFMRFIKGNESDQMVLDENIGIKSGTPVGYEDVFEGNLNIIEERDISLMDIFTSSQMMSNANINKDVNAEIFNKSIYGQKVLEPIAPMLSLSSLSIDISGMGVALFSSKVGSMSIKLHDRSRLADISHLVAANQFGSTKMVIEFGWSHPDGGPLSNNIIGQYLNCLRDRGIYTVKASSFSFNDSNTVDITIGLACYGAQSAKSIPAAAGSKVPINAFRETINKINADIQKRQINELESQKKEKSEIKEVRHLLRAESRNSISANRLITYETYRNLLKAYKNYKLNTNNEKNRKALRDEYEKLLNINEIVSNPDLADTEAKQKKIDEQKLEHKENVTQLLYGKLYALEKKPDTSIDFPGLPGFIYDPPELSLGGTFVNELGELEMGISGIIIPGVDPLSVSLPLGKSKNDFNEFYQHNFNHKITNYSLKKLNEKIENETFNTMGRIMMSFIGHPLAVSGMFDEVQMVFYPFNATSGGARIHTTASLPIEYSLFKKKLVKKLADNASLSVSGFFSFFEKEIIRDRNLYAYGIGQVAEQDREDLKKEEANLQAKAKQKADIDKEIDKAYQIKRRAILDQAAVSAGLEVETDDSLINNYEFQIKGKILEKDKQVGLDAFEKKLADALKSEQDLRKTDLDRIIKEKENIVKKIERINSLIENKIEEMLKKLYVSDGDESAEAKFTLPNISIFFETLNVRSPNKTNGIGDVWKQLASGILNVADISYITDAFKGAGKDSEKAFLESKTICRIHIYDEKTDADPRRKLIQSMITEGNTKAYVNGELASDASGKTLNDQFNGFVGSLSAYDLRQYIKRGYPSITYGANNSTVEGISVSSNVSDNVSQVIQIASYANRNNPQNQEDSVNDLEEVVTVPASVSFKTFGMPFIFRGNQIYIDFGTNTTLDNVYTVKSVNHSIAAGKFETSVSLIFAGQGDSRSLLSDIKRTFNTLLPKEDKK